MKKMNLFLLCFLLIPLQNAFAHNCDLKRFRWDCVLTLHPYKTAYAQSLVYCDSSFGYLTRADYAILERYQRVSVNVQLKVNGEFVAGPCIGAHR